MQANPSLSSSLSLNPISDDQDQVGETAANVCEDFTAQLKLIPSDDQQESQLHEAEDEIEEDDDFSFACAIADKSQISADDVFENGQIRPFFPLFNRDLLFADYDSETSDNRLPLGPAVKVFVEAPPPPASSETDGDTDGPYCAWSKKAIEASPEVCKKSNSTGFSKLWRFRDYMNRSNSDGRDAFVFLNDSSMASAKREEKVVEKSGSSSEKKTASQISSQKKTSGEVKVITAAGGKGKVKKGVKGKTTPSLSPHEIYMRNKGSHEDDRRRSYLPYRPELVGFFTNVNGGLSRNVHPF